MKSNTIYSIILCFMVVFTTRMNGQNDPTNDSWEDTGTNTVATDRRVEMGNYLIMGEIGRIGVNTSVPSAQVHIEGLVWPDYTPGHGLIVNGRFNNYAARITNDFNSGRAGGLLIETANGNSILDGDGEVFNALKVVTIANHPTADKRRMLRIPNTGFTLGDFVLLAEDGGKVGIGVSEPAYELDICGFTRATEIIVETDWCDYVFAKEYRLPSLMEQQQFIEKNGHLKNFESEEDMNGQIHVGDVNKRQQQTIEEIMLYLIEMKDEITDLKAENKALKAEMEALKLKK